MIHIQVVFKPLLLRKINYSGILYCTLVIESPTHTQLNTYRVFLINITQLK
jgi:hypothetical protein